MSRTFHSTSKYPPNYEFIERRLAKLRGGEEYDDEKPEKDIVVSRRTRVKIRNIGIQSDIAHNLVRWVEGEEDRFIWSLYNGTKLDEFETLKQEEVYSHRIFSQYTQEKVAQLLGYNPVLLDDYLNWWKEPMKLLEYSWTIRPAPLSEDIKDQLFTKMWAMLYALIPPKEFREATLDVQDLITRVNLDIDRTHQHIVSVITWTPYYKK